MPSAKAAISKTPIGPFQNTVCASASAAANAAPTPGPMSSPSWSAGIASAGDDVVARASADGNSVSTTMSVGQHDLDARLLGPLEVAADGVELVLLEQALADLVALGLEEGEDHAAADQQPVGLAEQVVDDAELVGDLRAAEHDDVGPLRVVGEPAQHLDLGRDQAAHRVRQPLRRRRTRWPACGARRRSRR